MSTDVVGPPPARTELKPSDVPWIGDIPIHWDVVLLRLVARIESGHTPSRQHPEYWVPEECVVPWFSLADVWQLREGNLKFLGETAECISELGMQNSSARLLPAGTVVLSRTASVGFSGIMPHPMATTQDFVNWVCGPRITSDYLMWVFRAMKPEFERLMMGSTHQTIYMPDVGQFRGPLPPLAEQHCIAAFLDHETARIDALIEKKRRQVELLHEKWATLISHAVTRGLDPNAPTKDSGIDWLGHIPAHWTVARVKHVARLESGHTPSRSVPEHWLDSNEIPWVSLNDTKWLSENDWISDTTYRINALGLQNSSARLLPARVVVFTRDATIGKAAITTRPMAVSQHLIAWVCGPTLLPEFLLRVFYAMEPTLERYTFGATIRTIGMDDVRTMVTPLPPLDEQQRIVHWIAARVERISSVLEKVNRSIDRLREYRAALITAAVTGKIDVSQELA